MTDEKTVPVSLKDLCDFADAVDGMMHDLHYGQRDYLRSDIDRVHLIVERWLWMRLCWPGAVTPTTGVVCVAMTPNSRSGGCAGTGRLGPTR